VSCWYAVVNMMHLMSTVFTLSLRTTVFVLLKQSCQICCNYKVTSVVLCAAGVVICPTASWMLNNVYRSAWINYGRKELTVAAPVFAACITKISITLCNSLDGYAVTCEMLSISLPFAALRLSLLIVCYRAACNGHPAIIGSIQLLGIK